MTAGEGEFATLMQQLCEGSQDAAWEFVERYGPHIQRAVRRTLTREIRSKFDSQDFVQAVWASFFAHRSRVLRVEKPEQLIALLASMAKHKIIDEIRKRMETQKYNVRRERPLNNATATLEDKLRSHEPTPSQVAIAREQWNRLLQGEPAHYRKIVQLRFVGETYQAIARKLHINERTVRRVLNRLVREKVA